MRHLLILLAAVMSLSGLPASASTPDAACQLTALTFANQDFQDTQAAQQGCATLLAKIHDQNANDCQVREFQDQNGNFFARARLRVRRQVKALTLGQALQQLSIAVLNGGLLSDQALGLRVTTQGACQ